MNEVTYLITWEPDDYREIDGSFSDRKDANEIKKRFLDGDDLAWCVISVAAIFRGHGSEPVTLGGCSYESLEEFKESGYYRDMCKEALELLTKDLEKAHNTYLALKDLPMYSLDFEMYGHGDCLTDHHHGDREELIRLSCLPSDEWDLRILLVVELTHGLVKCPAEISVPQAKAIVADADASVLHGFAQIPAETLALIHDSEDGYDSDDGVALWFLLTW